MVALVVAAVFITRVARQWLGKATQAALRLTLVLAGEAAGPVQLEQIIYQADTQVKAGAVLHLLFLEQSPLMGAVAEGAETFPECLL